MKYILILSICIVSSCTSVGQRKIESFPKLSSFIDKDYSQVNNIFPIATITLEIQGKTYKIPISYSLLDNSVDSSNFLITGEFIDNYSYKMLDNGKFKPMFKKETLLLSSEWSSYLTKTRQKVDSMKSKINLNNYLRFLPEPEWWQNDSTPLNANGIPMTFICQLELIDFTTDDCCLYIFLDTDTKLVKQIYQRD